MISATALATMPAAAGQLPWQALGSVDKPKDGRGECDDGGSVPGGLFEAGGDVPQPLELGGAALDQVALRVDVIVERVRACP